MKRGFLILILIGVVAKLLALGASKLVPNSEMYLEKEPLQKILRLFKNQERDTALPHISSPPKFVLPKSKGGKSNQNPQNPMLVTHNGIEAQKNLVHQKAVAAAKEEQKQETERRKKRKKKLEQAIHSDKKANEPLHAKMSNQKNKKIYDGNNDSSNEVVALGPVLTPIAEPNKKKVSDSPIQPITQKISVDLGAWEKLLLKDPSPTQFKAFLNLYKTNGITRLQYYSVLKTLQRSSNPAARNLAILGASTEPSSEAFQILATAVYSEQEKTLQGLALQRISIYAKNQYLSILNQAFHDGESHSKFAATQAIGVILQAIKAQPQSLQGDTRAQLVQFASALTNYIKSLTGSQSSQGLYATAKQTLADVNLILGLS